MFSSPCFEFDERNIWKSHTPDEFFQMQTDCQRFTRGDDQQLFKMLTGLENSVVERPIPFTKSALIHWCYQWLTESKSLGLKCRPESIVFKGQRILIGSNLIGIQDNGNLLCWHVKRVHFLQRSLSGIWVLAPLLERYHLQDAEGIDTLCTVLAYVISMGGRCEDALGTILCNSELLLTWCTLPDCAGRRQQKSVWEGALEEIGSHLFSCLGELNYFVDKHLCYYDAGITTLLASIGRTLRPRTHAFDEFFTRYVKLDNQGWNLRSNEERSINMQAWKFGRQMMREALCGWLSMLPDDEKHRLTDLIMENNCVELKLLGSLFDCSGLSSLMDSQSANQPSDFEQGHEDHLKKSIHTTLLLTKVVKSMSEFTDLLNAYSDKNLTVTVNADGKGVTNLARFRSVDLLRVKEVEHGRPRLFNMVGGTLRHLLQGVNRLYMDLLKTSGSGYLGGISHVSTLDDLATKLRLYLTKNPGLDAYSVSDHLFTIAVDMSAFCQTQSPKRNIEASQNLLRGFNGGEALSRLVWTAENILSMGDAHLVSSNFPIEKSDLYQSAKSLTSLRVTCVCNPDVDDLYEGAERKTPVKLHLKDLRSGVWTRTGNPAVWLRCESDSQMVDNRSSGMLCPLLAQPEGLLQPYWTLPLLMSLRNLGEMVSKAHPELECLGCYAQGDNCIVSFISSKPYSHLTDELFKSVTSLTSVSLSSAGYRVKPEDNVCLGRDFNVLKRRYYWDPEMQKISPYPTAAKLLKSLALGNTENLDALTLLLRCCATLRNMASEQSLPFMQDMELGKLMINRMMICDLECENSEDVVSFTTYLSGLDSRSVVMASSYLLSGGPLATTLDMYMALKIGRPDLTPAEIIQLTERLMDSNCLLGYTPSVLSDDDVELRSVLSKLRRQIARIRPALPPDARKFSSNLGASSTDNSRAVNMLKKRHCRLRFTRNRWEERQELNTAVRDVVIECVVRVLRDSRGCAISPTYCDDYASTLYMFLVDHSGTLDNYTEMASSTGCYSRLAPTVSMQGFECVGQLDNCSRPHWLDMGQPTKFPGTRSCNEFIQLLLSDHLENSLYQTFCADHHIIQVSGLVDLIERIGWYKAFSALSYTLLQSLVAIHDIVEHGVINLQRSSSRDVYTRQGRFCDVCVKSKLLPELQHHVKGVRSCGLQAPEKVLVASAKERKYYAIESPIVKQYHWTDVARLLYGVEVDAFDLLHTGMFNDSLMLEWEEWMNGSVRTYPVHVWVTLLRLMHTGSCTCLGILPDNVRLVPFSNVEEDATRYYSGSFDLILVSPLITPTIAHSLLANIVVKSINKNMLDKDRSSVNVLMKLNFRALIELVEQSGISVRAALPLL